MLIRTSRAGSTADQKDQYWHSHIGYVRETLPGRQAAECRAASSARIASMTGRIRSWADSAVEHLAQPGGERVRGAGLAVLPAQEAAVVAREPRRPNPEGSGDSHRAALRE